jgi:hypothetical protein
MAQAETTDEAGTPVAHEPLSPGTAEGQRRRPAGPSLRPALVVVGLALFLVLAFGIGSALNHNPTPKAPSPSRVNGTDLVAQPSAATLRPIEILGTPPADVLDALVLPRGAHTVSVTKWSGTTQYAGKMTFRLGASQAALVAFFRTELHAHGWSIVNVGPARNERGAIEVLAQRASADGWFWEAGVVVFPTTFGPGSSPRGATRFSLDLYQMPDAT